MTVPLDQLVEMLGNVNDSQLQRVGRAALTVYVIQRTHDANIVRERQGHVGPGSTQESARDVAAAQQQLAEEIESVLGAAQAERDHHILDQAVRDNIDDETIIVHMLGRELMDRDRYHLRDQRAAKVQGERSAAEAAGVSGATEKTDPPPTDPPVQTPAG